jgi:sulfide:quinone oxidoreductase
MADVVVLGAGLGGTLMAYELVPQLREGDTLTLVSEGKHYHFVPSNPWVAVGWRKRNDVEIDLQDVMRRKGIRLLPQGAERVFPRENQIALRDGTSVHFDYLVIATGPDLAFDEVEGFGPQAHTHSICHIDHAEDSWRAFEAFCKNPGPIVIGAAPGASCFGPAYEFAYIIDRELSRRTLRDRVPMTFVTPEPYIGHLGLDGVGDTKSLMESEFRQRHIKWITNARVTSITERSLRVEEVDEDGKLRRTHELPSHYTMLLPAFRGVAAVRGVEGLTNPRGMILVDQHQANPTFQNIFAIGVCVAIPPTGPTPVPVGVPKTGFMIESMVTATAHNIGSMLRGQAPREQATWNAVCLADFGNGGVAFVAQPQIPPRNFNWSGRGRWVHFAKVAFEKYFLRKVRTGKSEPVYEKILLRMINVTKLKATRFDPV